MVSDMLQLLLYAATDVEGFKIFQDGCNYDIGIHLHIPRTNGSITPNSRGIRYSVGQAACNSLHAKSLVDDTIRSRCNVLDS